MVECELKKWESSYMVEVFVEQSISISSLKQLNEIGVIPFSNAKGWFIAIVKILIALNLAYQFKPL